VSIYWTPLTSRPNLSGYLNVQAPRAQKFLTQNLLVQGKTAEEAAHCETPDSQIVSKRLATHILTEDRTKVLTVCVS
jgi:hypothetical protein